jgi:hypothetical protein
MAKLTDGSESADDDASSIKSEGASTVKGLAQVASQLFPLRQKRDGGKKLTKRELKQLDELETEYRELEQNLRELMRPRERDPWTRGRDHSHDRVS